MSIEDRLRTVKRLFLDTAPIIYDLIVEGSNTDFVLVDDGIARKAAELRAKYNLTLTDTIQVATALSSECDAFLTNDIALKRVSELNILVLDETAP